MKGIILAVVLTFLITAAIGPMVIKKLQKMKFGQKILEIGPKWHMAKQYTPTMGGFMFIVPIAVISIVLLATGSTTASILPMVGISVVFGLIGFVDDYAKVKKKQNMGLTPKQKLALQILAAVIFVTVLRMQGSLSTDLYIPFVNTTLHLHWLVYMIFAAFVIVGTVNAVNLTDGIDGLAAGVTLPVAVFFIVYGIVARISSVSVFAAALAGGLAAFLIYNFNPAKVFMGDTGSLFLGGCVAGLAFACDMPLILILVGLVYIIETVSDILQVLYFKATGGKRLFKMAPIHHHFEMCGWSEKEIVVTFSLLTVGMCVLAYFGVLPRIR